MRYCNVSTVDFEQSGAVRVASFTYFKYPMLYTSQNGQFSKNQLQTIRARTAKSVRSSFTIKHTVKSFTYIFILPRLVATSHDNTFHMINCFVEVLQILQAQFLVYDLHISYWIYITLDMGNIFIFEYSCSTSNQM